MSDKQDTIHPSFGLVCAHRVSCGKTTLVGSAVQHQQVIALTIRQARHVRDTSLHTEYYMGEDNIVEVEMSELQFAEFITSMNVGHGVPCTIRYVGGERVSNPPKFKHDRAVIQEECKSKIAGVGVQFKSVIAEVITILEKKAMNKSDREKILEAMNMVKNLFESSLPFTIEMMNEAIEKTIQHAKGELEAYANNRQITGIDTKYISDTPPDIEAQP